MKKRIIALLLFPALIITLSFLINAKKWDARTRLISQILSQGLEAWHYSGKKIDDNFSTSGFAEYLRYIDYNKQFLLKPDVELLKQYQFKVDNEFERGTTELMDLATKIIQQRIQQVMAFYPEILAKPFDFNVNEYIEFNGKKKEYCTNLAKLKDHWRKSLKYRILIRYVNLLKTKDDQLLNGRIDQDLEKKARMGVLKSVKGNLKRLMQANKNDALSRYFNSLTSIYDPHSSYFPPKAQADFNIEMTGTLEGIGALLGEEDGFVKVVRIVPGGPSWKQKQLQPEDRILKVAQGDQEPVDIVGMRTVDAVKLIRGKKGSLVKLTVKKPDSRIMIIPIIRDVVVIEESFAKSLLYTDKDRNKTYGYIYLPNFYNDFSRKNGRNSTNDVKKEIIKLKNRKVSGIILDLRNNGGGTLMDAVRMSGLFIPKGPIVQVKARKSKVKVLNDPDYGVSYYGPVVVLINSLSASASEILAAALQDYSRAVIVGGSHSFGKGTVQIMVNLDNYVTGNTKKLSPLGALKITTQKFYRITGSSNQYQGVVPDVIIPDRFDHFKIGEKYLDYSLKGDTTNPVRFKKWSETWYNTDYLQQQSDQRLVDNNYFIQLKRYIKILKDVRNKTNQSLLLRNVLKEQKMIKDEIDCLKKLRVEIPSIELHSIRDFEITSERLSKANKASEKDWFDQIKKDYLLYDAAIVLHDMIKMTKTGNNKGTVSH